MSINLGKGGSINLSKFLFAFCVGVVIILIDIIRKAIVNKISK